MNDASPKLKVGDTIWVYSRWPTYDKKQRWEPQVIRAETSRSWIYGPKWSPSKIPKKADSSTLSNIAFSEAEVNDRIWLAENRHKVADHLRYTALPIETWKQIAALIGYKEQA